MTYKQEALEALKRAEGAEQETEGPITTLALRCTQAIVYALVAIVVELEAMPKER